MDKQEVIMLQDALESLFYFQELMPKLTILKLFFVFQHFSSLCSHCYLFVILFTKHSNITIKEDAHWVIISHLPAVDGVQACIRKFFAEGLSE